MKSPENFEELLKKDSLVILNPLENRRLILPLLANRSTNSSLQISAITDEERESDIDYFDIMRENIDTLKKELYD